MWTEFSHSVTTDSIPSSERLFSVMDDENFKSTVKALSDESIRKQPDNS